jgi:hypothetical protein
MVLAIVQVTDGQFVASSPDERAILEACFNNGLVYNGELSDGRISVTVQGEYTELHLISFGHSCINIAETEPEAYRDKAPA